MSRYLERAEHSARVVDVYLGLTLDGRPTPFGGCWSPSAAPPKGYGVSTRAGSRDAAPEMRLNATIEACVVAARENARHIREQISGEMWEQLNRMYLLVAAGAGRARGRRSARMSRARTCSTASPIRR